MKSHANKVTLWLSSIIALRFLGLFIVLPILSLYAHSLDGATPFLIGVAIGGYALTQMLLQYPLGKASDKFGRKKVIVFGLLIFALGSVVCVYSSNIYLLILGRLLQGAGAISSTITAMISDFTKEEERSKAMAVMGGAIALSFMISMIFGPILGGYIGMGSLFWLTFVFALLAIAIIVLKIPESESVHHEYYQESTLGAILKHPELFKMNVTMFFHSFMMTVAFLVIPITLVHHFEWEKTELWKVYLPAIVAGFFAMGLAAVMGEKKDKTKLIFVIAVFLFGLGFLFFGASSGDVGFGVGVVIFFIGFMMLEPLLQSTVTKIAKIHERGAALGVFNTVQFLGVFLGGAVGGYLLDVYGFEKLAFFMVFLSAIWLIWVSTLKNPIRPAYIYMPFSEIKDGYEIKLKEKSFIIDFYLNKKENILVIKFNPKLTNIEDVKQLVQ